jgi:hypothetical protein
MVRKAASFYEKNMRGRRVVQRSLRNVMHLTLFEAFGRRHRACTGIAVGLGD